MAATTRCARCAAPAIRWAEAEYGTMRAAAGMRAGDGDDGPVHGVGLPGIVPAGVRVPHIKDCGKPQGRDAELLAVLPPQRRVFQSPFGLARLGGRVAGTACCLWPGARFRLPRSAGGLGRLASCRTRGREYREQGGRMRRPPAPHSRTRISLYDGVGRGGLDMHPRVREYRGSSRPPPGHGHGSHPRARIPSLNAHPMGLHHDLSYPRRANTAMFAGKNAFAITLSHSRPQAEGAEGAVVGPVRTGLASVPYLRLRRGQAAVPGFQRVWRVKPSVPAALGYPIRPSRDCQRPRASARGLPALSSAPAAA